jgi:Fe-S cluster biogenesis protein NfuA
LSQHLEVQVQTTPNPFALKFIANQPLKSDGKATFNTPDEAIALPLVQATFSVPGVRQVHLFQNTMTVSHTGDLVDDDLIAQVRAVMESRMPIHNPEFEPKPEAKAAPSVARQDRSPEIQQMEEILDRTVRPGLQSDGGDIEIISFENNEVRVLYQGACGGCPSSMMGTLDAIQSILQHELDNPGLVVSPI